MGRTKRTEPRQNHPNTPSSPSSSSSSEFEFTVALSPSSRRTICPADELFYKGQLLPLHLSPRISMVRTLLLASSSTSSSSDTTTTASRDSTSSSSDSSRPSSATDDGEPPPIASGPHKRPKYFSSFANRFSSAKEAIKKCVRKVRPLYEKLSSRQQQQQEKKTFSFSIKRDKKAGNSSSEVMDSRRRRSFSGNLGCPKRRQWAASCPSSMRSSPTHSGLLCLGSGGFAEPQGLSAASMDELHSAIQGAIAHCKTSLAVAASGGVIN